MNFPLRMNFVVGKRDFRSGGHSPPSSAVPGFAAKAFFRSELERGRKERRKEERKRDFRFPLAPLSPPFCPSPPAAAPSSRLEEDRIGDISYLCSTFSFL